MNVFDLEANGLLFEASKVHCCCLSDGREGLEHLKEGELVAHNGWGYDYPLLEKLYGFLPEVGHDTAILSRLFEPDRAGHSIEQYAKEFGMEKVGKDITDWSVLTPEMKERCFNDAKVGEKVWDKYKGWDSGWDEAIQLENQVA